MEITIINKDLTYHKKLWTIELEINKKVAEISVDESYNPISDTISVDWEYVEEQTEEITDEEHDEIEDWVNSFKYDKGN